MQKITSEYIKDTLNQVAMAVIDGYSFNYAMSRVGAGPATTRYRLLMQEQDFKDLKALYDDKRLGNALGFIELEIRKKLNLSNRTPGKSNPSV